ncbi:hypothetical protein SFC08_01690 [Lysinibacillus halotolerans]
MNVYLWSHKEGVFLVNEKFTMISKPYFVTHPKRTNILKQRFEPWMEKQNLLATISNEDLQNLVNNSVIHWKSMIPFKVQYLKEDRYGFEEKYIAKASLYE